MSTPPPSASALRRAQRRRAQLAGGGNLASDRGELLSQQHERQLVDATPKARQIPDRPSEPHLDRSAIVWLPAPARLGAGSSRCAVVGYVDGTVLPAWLAALLEEAPA